MLLVTDHDARLVAFKLTATVAVSHRRADARLTRPAGGQRRKLEAAPHGLFRRSHFMI